MKNRTREIDPPANRQLLQASAASSGEAVVPGIGCGAEFRGSWRALALLLVGLLVTGLLAHHEKAALDLASKREFDSVCKGVQLMIEGRLAAHARILLSGAAFFAADDNGVSRNEWREFFERRKLGVQLPGIQGIGLALLIPPSLLAQHIEAIRAEGFPDYRVKPEGERDAYSSIIFLEPFSGRNLRAFGYDMLSEPVRRAAMERARDQDEAVLSGKVTLVQETTEDVQAGTLMYVPVYRLGMPCGTVAERRAALVGWVYSPYRMNDLMQGILGNWDFIERWRIHLKIFDGETSSPAALLYDSQHGTNEKSENGLIQRNVIDVSGRQWLLSFSQAGGTGANGVVALILGGGTIISLLLSGLARSLINTRINARRIAERLTADLHQSEERYALTFDAVNDGLWDWNIPTGNAFFSAHYYSMLGYDNREFPATYSSWRSLVHPDDLTRVEEDLRRSVESGESFKIDLQMKLKSGKWQWVMTRGNVIERDAQGKVLRMVGTLSDITERKRGEDKIAAALEFHKQLLGSAPALIWRAGTDAKCDWFNTTWLEFTGRTMEQELGDGWVEGVHADDLDRCLKIYQDAFAARRPFHMDYRLRRPDATYSWISDFGISLNDISGNFCGYIGYCFDITERMQLEADLKASNRRLEASTTHANEMAAQAELANSAKSEFLATMSHEIRTPMNGVIGMTNLLLDTGLDAEQRHYAEVVRSSGESLLCLINDILDFSKIQAGMLQIEALDFDLSSLLSGLFSLVAVTAREKGLGLTCAADPAAPVRLHGDSRRLRQVLINLIGNAIKFTRAGEVAVRVALVEKTESDALLRFSVRDTGIGIPADKLARIFEKFVQADSSTARTFGGSGLGLAISKQLVELMGGEIGVMSDVGKGSEFWFTVRLAMQSAQAPAEGADLLAPARATPQMFGGRKARILLAEDNATSQRVALGMLEKLGLSADLVEDGESVINAVKAMPYDLVVMDMNMPGLSGLEATREIRKYEGERPSGSPILPTRIPIIAMTANAMAEARTLCLEAGMDDYLSKPVSLQGLAEILQKWLPEK